MPESQCNVMGHNWVLSKIADVQAVADGMSAGAARVRKEWRRAVSVATAIIGGGESKR